MKINVSMFGLDRTGGTIVHLRYLEALRRAGHEVSVTTLGRAGDRRFIVPGPDVDTTYVGLRSRPYKALVKVTPGHLGFPRREQRRLERAIPQADLQLCGYSLTVEPALATGNPVHYHVQHFEPLITQGRRAQQLALQSYLLDTYMTANCTWVAGRVADAGGTVRGLVCPAIDHDIFNAYDRRPATDGEIRVITLGKRVAWKGLTDIVEAIKTFAASRSEKVTLVSYGPDAPSSSLGRASLEHHGFVDQRTLAELYRSASVCVSASWYESFPLPPLEAMATGTPVICTRLGTEDYATHEENALVVPAREPAALVASLDRLVDDAPMRDELTANGIATARRFTWGAAEAAFVEHATAAAGERQSR